ncbi:MAG TPA: flavin reductase family protein [Ramlibacter sp.]|jgi:flavin reductase (DIM6/NTAB) family NADH-FMN oxidoreductase RutF
MRILAADLEPQQTYRLITGIVVPRPIAWVCTCSPEGVLNLAPFSAFTFVSNKPPMLGINVGRKAGVRKDTGRNIHETGEYVVHIGDESMVDAIHESAVEHPPEVSEIELLGLRTTPSDFISVPRLVAPPIAMECRLHQAIAFGATGSEFIVGEVLAFHIRDGLLRDGKIDSTELNPVCRLAGPNYATLGRVISKRPLVQTDKTVMSGAEDRG